MADKRTPGPLRVGGSDKCTIYDKFGQRVGNTFEGVMAIQRSDAECRANALLFSVAPELLELLQDWVNDFADCLEGGEADPLVSATRAAIAKATGANT